MREIRIDICQLSPRTGLLLRTGTVRSCIIPRVGECIRHRDKIIPCERSSMITMRKSTMSTFWLYPASDFPRCPAQSEKGGYEWNFK